MNRIFTTLRRLLAAFAARETQGDALAGLSTREFADLPTYHPRHDA